MVKTQVRCECFLLAFRRFFLLTPGNRSLSLDIPLASSSLTRHLDIPARPLEIVAGASMTFHTVYDFSLGRLWLFYSTNSYKNSYSHVIWLLLMRFTSIYAAFPHCPQSHVFVPFFFSQCPRTYQVIIPIVRFFRVLSLLIAVLHMTMYVFVCESFPFNACAVLVLVLCLCRCVCAVFCTFEKSKTTNCSFFYLFLSKSVGFNGTANSTTG